MKSYLWIILAAAGLAVWAFTHLYELIFGLLPFWIYLGLMGVSLLLLLAGIIMGLIRVFSRKKDASQP